MSRSALVLRIVFYPLLFLVGTAVIAVSVAALVLARTYPNLPDLAVLTDYRPKIPLRVYSSDGYLIGEFGEERRALVKIEDVPEVMKQALLAAEDASFYQHYGVDFKGIARAMHANLISQRRGQGASTITMQVARNFFLTPDRTYGRKIYEIALALKIEQNLGKDQIFELYINQIYLGQRAFGFEAASQIYFGKPLAEVSLAEAAMLAGLPQAPGKVTPILNPNQSKVRQRYVLRRMQALNFITPEEAKEALEQPLVIQRASVAYMIHADHVAEMARQIAAEIFPEAVYDSGLNVITTITREEQEAAWLALREGVLAYDRRQGYRGVEGFISLAQIEREAQADSEQDSFGSAIDRALHEYPTAENLIPAIVIEASADRVRARMQGGESIVLSGSALKFADRMLTDKAPPAARIRPGAVIRLSLLPKEGGKNQEEKEWQIAQLPEVEAAFAAISPTDGTVRALIGGFDFKRNQFNHVTQAWRQPGSSFKPFIYSAALEKGFSPGSIVLDEPIVIPASVTGSRDWEPKNYDGKYDGEMTLRAALAKSKNMVSIDVLQTIGPNYAQDYVTRFGFEAANHPPFLTMALGAGSVTPWQMVTAYSIFANGGYRTTPYIVKEITDQQGRVLARANPVKIGGDEKLRVLDPRNAYLMNSMLRDVTISGTAARASSTLKRRDLAGKTGTTNDYLDAWFCGYQKTVVGCAWLGFGQPRRLGNRETGGFAALPIWIAFMQTALKDVPESMPSQPSGITGAHGDMYYTENVPIAEPEPEPEEILPYGLPFDPRNIYAPRQSAPRPASPPVSVFPPVYAPEAQPAE
ncbi:MAG: PBP1A family penicillin-binding protein [Betaproteobacteria bacterium]|nr:PBP1A family penicillin-binding protein [Betaproteobacteria bacterium]